MPGLFHALTRPLCPQANVLTIAIATMNARRIPTAMIISFFRRLFMMARHTLDGE